VQPGFQCPNPNPQRTETPPGGDTIHAFDDPIQGVPDAHETPGYRPLDVPLDAIKTDRRPEELCARCDAQHRRRSGINAATRDDKPATQRHAQTHDRFVNDLFTMAHGMQRLLKGAALNECCPS